MLNIPHAGANRPTVCSKRCATRLERMSFCSRGPVSLLPQTLFLQMQIGEVSGDSLRPSPGASATRAATVFCRCWSHCSGSSSRRSASCKMRQVVPARAFLGGLQPNRFVSLLAAPARTAPLQRPPPLPTARGARGRAGPRWGRHSPLRIRRRTGEEAGGGRRRSRGAEELHGRRAQGSAVVHPAAGNGGARSTEGSSEGEPLPGRPPRFGGEGELPLPLLELSAPELLQICAREKA
jgi:hypothetical protein